MGAVVIKKGPQLSDKIVQSVFTKKIIKKMINFFRRLKFLTKNVIKAGFSDKYLLATNCIISVSLSSGKNYKTEKLKVKL